jgi:hypothetical protein
MKECYKRKNHISRKLCDLYIYIYIYNIYSDIVRPPVTKNFTTLHTTTELFHADRRRDTTNLIFAFRNFANAPKNHDGLDH